jgi:hypothetical protein
VLFSNYEAQVVFRDWGEPVAIALLRPMNLRKEGKRIIGTFLLEDREKNIREWVMGFYLGGIGAFVVNAAPEQLDFVNTHPNRVNYLDAQARKKVASLLSVEEKKGARKWRSAKSLEGESVLSRSSEWQPISSWGARVDQEPVVALPSRQAN